MNSKTRARVREIVLLACVLAAASVLHGERLPIKSFNANDGLAHDHINQILRDSRGYLWISTDEGLSKFDGYEFTNFTREDGLPHSHVNGVLEARDKGFWVATDGGVCWFDNKSFTVYHPPGGNESSRVNSLAEDARGTLWVGTNTGLFLLKQGAFEEVDRGKLVTSVRFDRKGSLWVATAEGVYRRDENGAVSHYLTSYINGTLQDSRGRHWILTRTEGFSILGEGSFSIKDGLPSNDIRSAYEAEPGRYWLATVGGLVEMTESHGSVSFRVYTTANGLSDNRVYKLESDGAGNLWIGTNHGGIQRIAREGVIAYTKEDGLQLSQFHSFSETRNGTMVLVSGDNESRTLHWFDGYRFRAVPLNLPPTAKGFGWGWNQHAFEDRGGRWWLPGLTGVYRYSLVKDLQSLGTLRPEPVRAMQEIGCAVSRLFEDSRGDVWMATTNDTACKHPNQLFVWRRQSGQVTRFDAKKAAWEQGGPFSFCEDTSGNLWVGLSGRGGLMRIHNERAERFVEADGVPVETILSLLCDKAGRLWIGSEEGGVARVDQPNAVKPHFTAYTTQTGLSSNEIWTLVEDNEGYVYAGTGRGLDRIDPKASGGTNSIKRLTKSDGFIGGEIRASYRDRQGTLWFASPQGVARLAPVPSRTPQPTPVWITAVRVNGVSQNPITHLAFKSDLRQLEIQFSGIDYTTDRQLLYQYKLEGADPDWNMPTAERRVNYASLAPGEYRFLVRTSGSEPAAMNFTVEPLIWQQSWFRALGFALIALTAYLAHRYRLTRVIAMERLRAQIATDLHDDIGSSLSQIAVLSEVARSRSDAQDPLTTAPLSRIGEISRELADSMSDIVWAINPGHDHMGDMVYRMRCFADEILSGSNIQFELVQHGSGAIPLHASARRDVFLIFKESLHNVVRHSGCAAVRVEIGVNAGQLSLQVTDNGTGFQVEAISSGQGAGLDSMQRRAARLRGKLTINSANGQGTSIQLKVPLRKHDYMNM